MSLAHGREFFYKKKLIRGQKQLEMTWVFLLPLDLRRHVECGVTNTLGTFWAFVVPNYIGEKQCSNVVYGWENIQDLWILLSRDIDSSRLSQPWLSHVSSAIVKLPTQEDVSIKQIQGSTHGISESHGVLNNQSILLGTDFVHFLELEKIFAQFIKNVKFRKWEVRHAIRIGKNDSNAYSIFLYLE